MEVWDAELLRGFSETVSKCAWVVNGKTDD